MLWRIAFSTFLSQAGAIADIGVVIGLCLTVPLKVLRSKIKPDIEIPLWLYAASALLVSAICLVASMWPSSVSAASTRIRSYKDKR